MTKKIKHTAQEIVTFRTMRYLMQKDKKGNKFRSRRDFRNCPEYYIEFSSLSFNYILGSLMEKKKMKLTNLAKKMKVTKGTASRYFDPNRNLSIKKFGEILFHLDFEIAIEPKGNEFYLKFRNIDGKKKK